MFAFSQYLGGAVFILSAKNLFSNGLVSSLKEYAPQVNSQDVITAGATSIRKVVPVLELPNILLAYNHAIAQTFVSATGIRTRK